MGNQFWGFVMAAATIHGSGRRVLCVLALCCAFGPGNGAMALEKIEFSVVGGNERLEDALRAASVLLAAERSGQTDAQDIFADARAEYGSLLNTLYAAGHYSAVINVYLDGQEAASIAPLSAPERIGTARVVVDPGPQFLFGPTRIRPLPGGTGVAKAFSRDRPAESGVILGAATDGVKAWRDKGHAKARVSRQDIVADHGAARLSADITLDPGPRLRFGRLRVTGQDRMRLDRIHAIAGLPEGEVFSPAELDRAGQRLRRTGVFKSVNLAEDDAITPPDQIGITATVVEQKRRRYNLGAELGSHEGLSLSGGWLHRNLLGGGERFEITADVTNIGSGDSGVDYVLGLSLDRPATLTPDTTLGLDISFAHLDEQDFTANLAGIEVALTHVFSDRLSGRLGLGYDHLDMTDVSGDYIYRHLALPVGLTWDRRDSKTDATRGFYIDVEAKPFLGFGITDSGARLRGDFRAYRGFGDENRLVLAGRLQAGAILGASLLGTPRDDLFYSGGGGTVRGQPYQSLGVNVLKIGTDDISTGGTHFLAGSIEARVKTGDKLGVVGFVDVGRVDVGGFFTDAGDWHAGAGLGVRYATGVGPIRLDIAAPVGGDTGDGIQIYVGLGQAF